MNAALINFPNLSYLAPVSIKEKEIQQYTETDNSYRERLVERCYDAGFEDDLETVNGEDLDVIGEGFDCPRVRIV